MGGTAKLAYLTKNRRSNNIFQSYEILFYKKYVFTYSDGTMYKEKSRVQNKSKFITEVFFGNAIKLITWLTIMKLLKYILISCP